MLVEIKQHLPITAVLKKDYLDINGKGVLKGTRVEVKSIKMGGFSAIIQIEGTYLRISSEDLDIFYGTEGNYKLIDIFKSAIFNPFVSKDYPMISFIETKYPEWEG